MVDVLGSAQAHLKATRLPSRRALWISLIWHGQQLRCEPRLPGFVQVPELEADQRLDCPLASRSWVLAAARSGCHQTPLRDGHACPRPAGASRRPHLPSCPSLPRLLWSLAFNAALTVPVAPSAKRLSNRRKWSKTVGNDGLSRVYVPMEKLKAERPIPE